MESCEAAVATTERSSDMGKLFVGGISSDTREEVLREHFSKYGQVEHVAVIRDRVTGNGRGFAFVQFADPVLAEKALDDSEIDKHVILGRTVEVKRAIPRSRQYQNTEIEYPSNENTLNNNSINESNIDIKSKKIFVGGLRDNITDSDLRTYFEKFGSMNDAVVMKDKWTKRSRGFGFVTFDSEDSVQKVLETSLHDLNGRMVEVKIAVPKGEHILGNNMDYVNNDYDNNNNNSNEYNMIGRGGMGFVYPPPYNYKLGFVNYMGPVMNPYGYNYGYNNYRGSYLYGPGAWSNGAGLVSRRGGMIGGGGYFGNYGNNGGYFGNYAGLDGGKMNDVGVDGVSVQLDSVKLDAQ